MNTQAPSLNSFILQTQQRKSPSLQWPAESDQLAKLFKTTRQQQNLSLKNLSDKCGISISTLSKIEKNQTSPSIHLLQQLAQALELGISELFPSSHTQGNLGRRVLTRRTEGVSHQTESYKHRLLAQDLSHKKLSPFTSTVRCRSLNLFTDWIRHPGEVFLMVLRGSVELHCEFYQPDRLEIGDSSYLDSNLGHALVSVSKMDAEVIWVASLS